MSITLRKRNRIEAAILVTMACLFLWINIMRIGPYLTNAIHSDVTGYYMYLPALFVYKDIHKIPTGPNFQGKMTNEKGEVYTKYMCGTAYFYLPFFLGAHLYAHLFHFETSGFSDPYYDAMMMCGVFWAFVGVFLLKRLLHQYFSTPVVWLTLLSIMLGTSFFNYASYETGMSHVYAFTLFAAIILTADHYYKTPTKKTAMLLGALAGWIIAARPTNAAVFLFLLLYRVASSEDMKERLRFFRQHWTHLLVAAPFFIAVLLPQLIYWKEMSGHWIIDSYVGEHFIYWKEPKIASVLFNTENGLFIYAPALLFMIWSLVARRKDRRTNTLAVGIVFCIITYEYASWWVWTFGGAFGHRCYVDYMPIFAFPMGVTMEHIVALKYKIARFGLLALLTLFCYYTVYLSELYMKIGIWDGPKWRWAWGPWWELVQKIF